ISGAKVQMKSSSGQSFHYSEIRPGVYESGRIRGVSGRTYTLQVRSGEKTYEAVSRMREAVKADTIGFKRMSFLGESAVFPTVSYSDPAGSREHYRFLLRINSEVKADIVTEDRFTNGKYVSELLYYDGQEIRSGDQLEIEMQVVDPDVYRY